MGDRLTLFSRIMAPFPRQIQRKASDRHVSFQAARGTRILQSLPTVESAPPQPKSSRPYWYLAGGAFEFRGMMSPLFLSKRRRTSISCRQAGFLAPGSAATRCARVPPSPVRAPSGFWDELPGYSGGTAPEFDRLPSTPLWGTTAARRAVLLARLRPSPELVKLEGSWTHRVVRRQPDTVLAATIP
jgi:hypothetical protein